VSDSWHGGLMTASEVESLPSDHSDYRPAHRVSALDGVRALAALGVVVYHAAGYLGLYTPADGSARYVFPVLRNLGNFGVAVFFVLSGYLLFREFVSNLLFDAERTSLPHYFGRRFLRIYPAYWVALIGFVIVVGAPAVAGGAFGLLTLTERHFSTEVFAGLPVAWTLYVEVAFYIFIPIFAGVLWLLCREREVKVRLAIVLSALTGLAVFAHVWVGLIVPSVSVDYRLRLLLNLPTYFGWFAAGMALSVASAWVRAGRSLPRCVQQLANRPWVCWSVAGIAYLTIVLVESDFRFDGNIARETTTMLQVRFLLQGMAALFFIMPMAISHQESRLRSFLGGRQLAWLGLVSYGVYLWHQTILRQLAKWFTFEPNLLGFLLLLAIVVPSAILFGWVSFRLIEKPALSLAK